MFHWRGVAERANVVRMNDYDRAAELLNAHAAAHVVEGTDVDRLAEVPPVDIARANRSLEERVPEAGASRRRARDDTRESPADEPHPGG